MVTRVSGADAARASRRRGTTDETQASRLFQRLGDLAVRSPLIVIGFWIAAAATLSLALPPLPVIAARQQPAFLPDDTPTMVTAREMGKAFHDQGADNAVMVVLTDEKGLGPADEKTYRTLVDKLHHDSQDVVMMQDFIDTPQAREVFTSKDQKAWYLPVGMPGAMGSPTGQGAYEHVVNLVKQTVAGSTLTASVAGTAATVADITAITERDLHLIETGTAILLLAILLIVYRNLVTMVVPLITIGLSMATAQGALAGLAELGLGVSAQTMIFMAGVLFGAGTDYAVFLISRYHDYVRRGADSDEAVRHALTSIGKVIAASAATVAVTFLAMVFTKLPVFATVGPALAIAVGVAFLAAVTLLPAILVLAGRRGWIKPRRELTNRLWRRSGIRIVRRPVIHLVASLIVLTILAGSASLAHYNFDDRKTVPDTVDSSVGYAAMARHFPIDTLLPEVLLVQSPHDLRTPKALADLEQMAQRVSQLPGIAMVRGVTRPMGESLEQARLAYQAGEVGNKLGDTSHQINDHNDDLNKLTRGADQLAGALGDVRNQVSQAMASLGGLVDALTFLQNRLGGQKTLSDIDNAAQLISSMRELGQTLGMNIADVNNTVRWADPILTNLDNSPCATDPACVNSRRELQKLVEARDSGAFDKVEQLARQLQSTQGTQTLESAAQGLRQAVGTATTAMRSMSSVGDGLTSRLNAMQQGANQLADGSRQLADGVQQLVEQTKKIGNGLNEASGFLLTMKYDASAPPMAGFYIPPQVLSQNDFKKAAVLFISPDGHAARYLIQTKLNPFSVAAMDQVNLISDTARKAQPNTTLADAKISMAGVPVGLQDTRDYYNRDLRFIVVATILIVLLILIILLRAIVAPLYLICSVVISYLSALGVGVIVFQFLLGQELHWSLPGLTFIILIAVGADYNLLLISRIRDESHQSLRLGIIRTVGSTGGVITAAGLIFAASMFGMLFATITTMVQVGFILGMGILLDTFLVRTITVPAIATLVGRANWWPSRFFERLHVPRPHRPRLHSPHRRPERAATTHRVKSDSHGRSAQRRVLVPSTVVNHHRHRPHQIDEDLRQHALPLFGANDVPKQHITNGSETTSLAGDGSPKQPSTDVLEAASAGGNGHPEPATTNRPETPPVRKTLEPKQLATNELNCAVVTGNGQPTPTTRDGAEMALDGQTTANGQQPVETNGHQRAEANGEPSIETAGEHQVETNGKQPRENDDQCPVETNGQQPTETNGHEADKTPLVDASCEDDRGNEQRWIGHWPADDATFPVGADNGHHPATTPRPDCPRLTASAGMS